MGKTFDQLDAIDALADADLFVVDDDSGSDTNKMTPLQLITYLESKQLDGLQLNEAVALTATSAELNVLDGITSTVAELNILDGVTATAAELNSAADGIGVSIPRQKVVEIGDWNMDSTGTVYVAHGVTFDKIVGVRAIVRNDANDGKYCISQGCGTYGRGEIDSINATNVRLDRTSGGTFDSVDFDSTSYNRGWVIIDYID